MNTGAPQFSGKRLAGRRIIITGAGSGIGKATAQLFAEEGAKLVILDRDKSAANFANTIAMQSVTADVTIEAEVDGAVREAARLMGGVDGLVNAAGIMPTGPIMEMPVETWRKVIDVNLVGTYLVTRSCVPFMRQAGSGSVVNIASAAGILPNAPNLTAYAASKGGVVNFTRALAAELAPIIRVNTVCPGMVDTPMADGHRANVQNYALKRMAQPVEIGRAILFLTGPESSYVTGAAFAIDGGRSFH